MKKGGQMIKLSMDLIILGPSGTGKTRLGNFLATQENSLVFNCDSVQIYRDLNLLTNKPEFTSQKIINDEVLSYFPAEKELDPKKYANIKFKVWKRENGNLENIEFENIEELLDLLKNCLRGTMNSSLRGNDSQDITNFLFDIRDPLQAYSTVEFEEDLERITKKFNLKNRIIVGGTIYYAYNFIFQLKNLESFESSGVGRLESVIPVFSERSEEKYRDLDLEIKKLKELDPESLNIIDTKNPRRVETALKYILKTGRKYSEEYFRPHTLRDNFILITLHPKNREEYYKDLDEVIDSRLNPETFEELEFLIKKYGEEIIPWLEKTSYEYKYFLQIYFQIQKSKLQYRSNQDYKKDKNILEILQRLKFKEHQYAKRQITFLRRLEKKIYSNV